MVQSLHGGSKPPPYNQPCEAGLHREATSSTKWTSSAKRISLRARLASHARRHFKLGKARAFQARSAFQDFAFAKSFQRDACIAPALRCTIVQSAKPTRREIPTLCVALRVRLRALPSAQDDISPALGVTTNCVRSVHGGSRTPALRHNPLTPARALIPKLARS